MQQNLFVIYCSRSLGLCSRRQRRQRIQIAHLTRRILLNRHFRCALERRHARRVRCRHRPELLLRDRFARVINRRDHRIPLRLLLLNHRLGKFQRGTASVHERHPDLHVLDLVLHAASFGWLGTAGIPFEYFFILIL